MGLVDKAIDYVERAHRYQYRKHSGLPYMVHCVEVLKRVRGYGVTDEHVLSAALLHDVIEDCNDTYESLAQEFGKYVAKLVVECSRLPEHNTKRLKLEFLKSFEEKEAGSIIIKIADRYCNVADFIHAGNFKYALKYKLQAYPLYEAYFKREHEIDESVRAAIRADIYDHNQDMKKVLGLDLTYIEVESHENEFFFFDRKAVDKLLLGKNT